MANRPDGAKAAKTIEKIRKIDQDLSRLHNQWNKYHADIRKNAEELRAKSPDGTITLSSTDKNITSTMLIRNLYSLHLEQNVLSQASTLFLENHDAIEDLLVKARPALSSFGWLFAGNAAKEGAISSLNALEQLSRGEYAKKAEELLHMAQSNKAKAMGNPWNDFNANSAPYYALLESICQTDSATPQPTHEGRTGDVSQLSEDLLYDIEATELDLSRLKANLRSYQTFGTKYIVHQKKVLLGDEMGLGKTMQAIASFCHLASQGATHFLVVCPLSVVVNWTREIESQSDLKTIEIYSKGRDEEMEQWVREGGVGITTFETLNKVPVPESASIDMMVVDEAHYIKNPNAQRTQSVLAAGEKATNILLMSGTPLENKVEEMNFLIRSLRPDIGSQIESLSQLTQALEYRQAIAPVYLRRVREDVLKELPELIEKEEWGSMNATELEMYRAALEENNFMALRQLSWHLSDLSQSGKATRLLEICKEMKEMNRKIIVFSFFKNTLTKVANLLGEDCTGIIDGSINSDERQKLIDDFSSDSPGSVLVCQIQAGGVGLNIQAASVIIFCEPQIKPSLETQAIARAYRMGQSQSVLVHRLLMQNSVDERVMAMLHDKTKLFEQFADDSVAGDLHISTEEELQADATVSEAKLATTIMEEEKKRLGM